MLVPYQTVKKAKEKKRKGSIVQYIRQLKHNENELIKTPAHIWLTMSLMFDLFHFSHVFCLLF